MLNMKTLIENTIKFKGIGHPDTITIFNIESEIDRYNLRFKELTVISGRKLVVEFKYSENDAEFYDRLLLTIIKSDDGEEIKNHIITSINSYLRLKEI